MKKDSVIIVRTDRKTKEKAMEVLGKNGISMSFAIDLLLRSIGKTGQIPVEIIEGAQKDKERKTLRFEEILSAVQAFIDQSSFGKNVKRISLFGSYAKGEANQDSDVDMVVEFDEGTSHHAVFDFMGDLENSLGKRVDIVTPTKHNESFLTSVSKEEMTLYERH